MDRLTDQTNLVELGQQADLLVARGDYPEAYRLYQGIFEKLAAHPDCDTLVTAKTSLGLLLCLVRSGRVEDALDLFTGPAPHRDLFKRGQALLRGGFPTAYDRAAYLTLEAVVHSLDSANAEGAAQEIRQSYELIREAVPDSSWTVLEGNLECHLAQLEERQHPGELQLLAPGPWTRPQPRPRPRQKTGRAPTLTGGSRWWPWLYLFTGAFLTGGNFFYLVNSVPIMLAVLFVALLSGCLLSLLGFPIDLAMQQGRLGGVVPGVVVAMAVVLGLQWHWLLGLWLGVGAAFLGVLFDFLLRFLASMRPAARRRAVYEKIEEALASARYQKALELSQNLQTTRPADAHARFGKALALVGLGKPEGLEACLRALESDTDLRRRRQLQRAQAQALMKRGDARQGDDAAGEALHDYELALEILEQLEQPLAYEAGLLRLELLERCGYLELALSESLELQASTRLHLIRSRLFEQLADREQALHELDCALKCSRHPAEDFEAARELLQMEVRQARWARRSLAHLDHFADFCASGELADHWLEEGQTELAARLYQQLGLKMITDGVINDFIAGKVVLGLLACALRERAFAEAEAALAQDLKGDLPLVLKPGLQVLKGKRLAPADIARFKALRKAIKEKNSEAELPASAYWLVSETRGEVFPLTVVVEGNYFGGHNLNALWDRTGFPFPKEELPPPSAEAVKATPERNFTHPAALTHLRLCPEKRLLVSGGSDGSQRLFVLKTGTLLGELSPEPSRRLVGFVDPTTLLTSKGAQLEFWKLPAFELGKRQAALVALATSPDHSKLAGTSPEARPALYDIASERLACLSQEVAPSPIVRFSHDGQLLAWAEAESVNFRELRQGRSVWVTPPAGAEVTAITFLRDGRAAFGCQDGSLLVVDPHRKKLLTRLYAPAPVTSLAISDKGMMAVGAGEEQPLVFLFELSSRVLVGQVDTGGRSALTLAFVDEEHLIAGYQPYDATLFALRPSPLSYRFPPAWVGLNTGEASWQPYQP